ncbi:MAG: hypothetical protein RL500_64 [Pseudomonadota bacterium]|jgi:hypothetical protein
MSTPAPATLSPGALQGVRVVEMGLSDEQIAQLRRTGVVA